VKFPDGWKAGTTFAPPVSLLDLLPPFAELAGTKELLAHDGVSLIPQLAGGDPDRIVFAQAHEAIGMPCVMARQGAYKYTYIQGYGDQLFDLATDPGEWTNLVEDPAHREAESRLKTAILQAFNPDEMARENLASLYRRRLVRDVNLKQGHTWAHKVDWDQRKGTLGQYF
jgi:arylsulfatase A-like enzyme